MAHFHDVGMKCHSHRRNISLEILLYLYHHDVRTLILCLAVPLTILLHKYSKAHSMCHLLGKLPEEKISYDKAFSQGTSLSK